ncbi:MAG: mandelate racemase/muconate lactonizing enzyme family protein [Anaerolineales bacterium]|nr:MAG: mandelate racemase/muconate lactonizing enzyme family protein [Anaerolineales bacterium]
MVARGFRCLKVYPYNGVQVITPERLARGVDIVSAIRDAVGPEIEIAWLEEPILYENAAALGAFARSVNVPVSTGEELYTRWEFLPLLAENAVGIIQPDICHAGGMSELRKIAAMAETYYVTVAPHNSNGPISTVASLHLDMSINNCHMQELFLNSLPYYQEVLTNPLIIEDGYGTPPAGPGWGTDLDDAVLAKYPPADYVPIEDEPYKAF